MNQNAYAAYIGIDWSDRKHDIYLYDCTTGAAEESVIGLSTGQNLSIEAHRGLKT
ncbi:hypothetical protein J5X98_18965 [Leptothermofonsia sichuanensis E412]|uniref:hypothetical protein n=1 Tax=Leptothermofonsia sichuanensis TaxID=2917832 RepID=UPI001CA73EDF|nr:hypothetical protein [Leptothermofonsia sichuanensis]QZZ19434.1 hypothetical protein J5X98_18965 [Leptothermofonsia sichuanensis E412]